MSKLTRKQVAEIRKRTGTDPEADMLLMVVTEDLLLAWDALMRVCKECDSRRLPKKLRNCHSCYVAKVLPRDES